MKYIIFFLFFLSAISGNSQDGFILTKKQHEELRKNLEDYKVLINDYKIQTNEFDKLKAEFELLKKLRNSESAELIQLKKDYLSLNNQKIHLENVLENYQNQLKEIEVLKNEIKRKNSIIITLQGKYYRERNKTRGDRILSGMFSGMFISCALIGIYYSWEENHNSKHVP
jgi:hypothetical protein